VYVDLTEDNDGFQGIGINKVEVEYQDYTNQFYIETLFQQKFSFGMGLEQKFLKITSETLQDREDSNSSYTFEKSNYYSTFAYLKLDSYDNKYFPTKGVCFDGDFHVYLFSSDFNNNFSEFSIARGSIGYAVTPLNRFTTRLSTETGFKIGDDDVSSLDFLLGGYGNNFVNNIIPFYGYDFLTISGDSYIKGMVELDYEIFHKNHIIASANFANVEDQLYTSGNWLSAPDYTGYALGYSLETFLGPVSAKYSYSPEVKDSQWYFSLGFWF